MARRLYETKTDLSNEARAFPSVAGFLTRRRGRKVVLKKMPEKHFSDAVAVLDDGTIDSYVEYKKRGMVWGDYNTIMLSAGKFLRLEELSRLPGVGAWFVVEDKNGLLMGVDLHSPYNRMWVEWGGRTVSTRDSMDVEPVCHFPIESFVEVGNVEVQGMG